MAQALRIALIGAGMSGLSCATALRQAGVAVELFEKSRGPSGRMSTRRGEGWQCDHGAQYFTARDAHFQAQVDAWTASGVVAPWHPRLAVFPAGERSPGAASVTRHVGTPSMTSPAASLLEALRPHTGVHLSTTVNGFERQAAGWRVTSAEHGWHEGWFDAVLLAVPSPQVLPLVKGHSPALFELAAQARMRGSWAVMARYGQPLPLPFDAAFVNKGPLRWVARDNHKPGRPEAETWLLHASAEWSEAHLEETPEQAAEALLQAFAALGGPAPLTWTAHRWRYADTDPHLGVGSAWDPITGLGLCGDWLHTGKVEGAWLSGRELALQVMAG